MAVILSVLWFFGTIACIWFIIRPKKDWVVVATRLRALGCLVAVFVGIPILMSATGLTKPVPATPPTPAQPSKPLTPEEIAAKKVADEKQAEEDARSNPEKYLTIQHQSATNSGFGVVMMFSGTIKSTAPIDLKDPKIECIVYADSGTKLGSTDATDYKIIRANSSLRVHDFNMGFVNSQWSKFGCTVIGASPAGDQ